MLLRLDRAAMVVEEPLNKVAPDLPPAGRFAAAGGGSGCLASRSRLARRPRRPQGGLLCSGLAVATTSAPASLQSRGAAVYRSFCSSVVSPRCGGDGESVCLGVGCPGFIFFGCGDGGFCRRMAGSERVWWMAAGGSSALPRLCRWEAVESGSEEFGGVPRPACHSGYVSADGGPLFRSTKQRCCDGASSVLRELVYCLSFFRRALRRRRKSGSAAFGGAMHRDPEGLICISLLSGVVCAFSPGQLSSWFFPGCVCVCCTRCFF